VGLLLQAKLNLRESALMQRLIFLYCWQWYIKETKSKTKERNNIQTVNKCIRNLDTNKER